MTVKKKRTSLDALGISATVSLTDTGAKTDKKASVPRRSAKAQNEHSKAPPTEKSPRVPNSKDKKEIVKSTVYVPAVVYEQWRELAFTERKKMHDYLIEGLNRVFADRGLKSIGELTGKE